MRERERVCVCVCSVLRLYNRWYRNLCMRRSAEQWRPGAVLISAQTRVAPYLLRMKWKGFPLHYHDHLGWGYIVPLESRPGEVPEWDEEDNVGSVSHTLILLLIL